jgi:small subunit ribosomal protein S1
MSSTENASYLETTRTGTEDQAEMTPSVSSPPDSGEVGQLLASMQALSPVNPGEIVRGTILKLTEGEVLIDIGLKCEAAVPRAEFLSKDGQLSVGPGDVVDVWVERYDETAGTVVVSRQKAAQLKLWEEIEQAFNEQKTLRGRVLGRIKGGLTVDIWVTAFLPGSQADTHPHFNLDALKGQEIACKVIKINIKRSNVVVSRKLALEEELNERKAKLLENLTEGAELVGRVKNLTDYGVFVDLGGMDGLLHITDLSWGRVAHPSEVVKVGEEIRVMVVKYDPEKGRVSLGLKQLSPDPWEQVPSTCHAGERVTGRVVSIADYGAFVELQPGVEGLVHISEMSWSRRLRHPSKIVNLGDRVEVTILDVNPTQRRISLSLKQTLPDPWTTLIERMPAGSVVEGWVRNLTDFGAFIEIEDGVDGLIHLSNISWTKTVKHPSEVLKKGDRVQAVVLSLDAAKRRLSLGLKQLQPDGWEDFCSKTHVGDIVRGRVLRLVDFGAFVELSEGIEAICHVSEYDQDPAGQQAVRLEVGSELDFRVIRLHAEERKIRLSLKNVRERPGASDEGADHGTVKSEAMVAATVGSVQCTSSVSPEEDDG